MLEKKSIESLYTYYKSLDSARVVIQTIGSTKAQQFPSNPMET